MSYAEAQMFMRKLEQLIHCNDIPVINIPSIICERPQFQLLYEELDSMIQTISNHEDQDLHNFVEVREVRKRFKAAAEEAEYIIDIFLSAVHCRNNGYFRKPLRRWYFPLCRYKDSKRQLKRQKIFDVFQTTLNLDNVMRSIKSIKVEFMTTMIDHVKIDSSQRTNILPMQSAAGTSRTRNSRGSKKVLEEMAVGLDRHAEIIRDKLVEDTKHLDVVSIVGMGGIGKTTLANKVFTDPYVKYHFYVRGWVTVSQMYDKHGLLKQVLSSIDVQQDLEEATDSQLHQMLHRSLYRKRYLIVIDDIWSKEAWDKLKLFFPDHNNGSRILLTSRITEVSLHTSSSHGLIHHLKHLNEEESWELLCGKVFQGDECPEWLIEPGMQIAKSCHGLPLSVVVMAGVLAKEPRTEDLWLKICCSVNSYIASDEKGCLETIALSYDHLPLHLRDCFLYFGEFSEDFRFDSYWLLHVWMAEGFIQEDGNRSLEEIANGYLRDLVDRNLIIVVSWYAWGDVASFKVHDLVRQLCVEKGKEERFFPRLDSPPSYHLCDKVIITHKDCHMLRDQEIDIICLSRLSTPSIRSLMCADMTTTLFDNISEFFQSFALLRVLKLNIGNCELTDFPPGLALLVHLRYLDIWLSSFLPSICNLWNLQTLKVRTSSSSMVLPGNISDLVNLRYLNSDADLYLPSIEKQMMSLESIFTNVVLGEGVDNFENCFPGIKVLTTTLYSDVENDFEGLLYLETLVLTGSGSRRRESAEPEESLGGEPEMRKNHNIIIRFPITLKELVLERCRLPWSEMLIIQSLPNLEILILKDNGFEGTRWETGEEQFQQLKVLKLKKLNIKQWEASSINFPCLQELVVKNCIDLEEIPLELGDISTLESIFVRNCGASVMESLEKIRQEQDDAGNCDLVIYVDASETTCSVPNHDD